MRRAAKPTCRGRKVAPASGLLTPPHGSCPTWSRAAQLPPLHTTAPWQALQSPAQDREHPPHTGYMNAYCALRGFSCVLHSITVITGTRYPAFYVLTEEINIGPHSCSEVMSRYIKGGRKLSSGTIFTAASMRVTAAGSAGCTEEPSICKLEEWLLLPFIPQLTTPECGQPDTHAHQDQPRTALHGTGERRETLLSQAVPTRPLQDATSRRAPELHATPRRGPAVAPPSPGSWASCCTSPCP